MQRLREHPDHRKTRFPRRTIRLIYRRDGWELSSAPKYRRFDSIEEVAKFLRDLRMRRASGLYGRLEERDSRTGRWRELPELATLWAESGWPR
jgi:hypothetical protein